MFSRRLIQRMLTVAFGGMDWQLVARIGGALYSLQFRIATGQEARKDDPFVGDKSDRLIVSADTLSNQRTFERLAAEETEA